MYDRDFWDERYSQDGFLYGTAPNRFLEQNIDQLPASGRVLCLAEGEGRNALLLARKGFDVEAIDISAQARKKALDLAAQNNCRYDYQLCDVNDFDFGESRWDAIISVFAHNDADTRAKTLARIVPSLKQAGVFLQIAYHPRQLDYGTGGPADPGWLVSADALLQYVGALEALHLYEGERDIREGTGHKGLAYVTEYIGRKK